MIVVTLALSTSCEEERSESRELAEELAGEWKVVQMYFPANDSTAQVDGLAVFGSSISSEGYFVIDNETVNFTYNVTHFSGVPSKISMGPAEGQAADNILLLQPSSYDISTLDNQNLTIDLAFCDFSEGFCTTVHRHIIMTR